MIVYRKKTSFNDLTVTREGHQVTLWSPDGVRQTAIDERNPAVPALEYAFNTALALAVCRQPGRALVLGLGGGAIPTMFRNLVTDICVDVVEIDPHVCQVAEEFFHFKPDDALQVFVADADDFLGNVQSMYDIIVLDAYVGSDMPSPLTSDKTLGNACAALNAGGVFVANLWASKREHLDRVMATIRQRFRDVKRLYGKRSQNMLAFAGNEIIDTAIVQQRAALLQRRLPGRFPIARLARELR